MRAIILLFLFICTGVFAQAQDAPQPKVQTVLMPITQPDTQVNFVKEESTTEVAGIFVLKNSRVRRALTFKIREKDAKLV